MRNVVFPENFLFGSQGETKESLSGIQTSFPVGDSVWVLDHFSFAPKGSKRKVSGKTFSLFLHCFAWGAQ